MAKNITLEDMGNHIRYAWSLDTLSTMHIRDAVSGLACNCKCFECGEMLEAVKCKLRTSYFRHSKNVNCAGGSETALHQLAKEIIFNNSNIKLPIGQFAYLNPVLENKLGDFRTDVTVQGNEFPVHFEIRVTNQVKKIKGDFFVEGKHASVEIDLTKTDRNISRATLTTLLIHNCENKRNIYWPASKSAIVEDSTPWWEKISSYIKFEYILIGITLLIAFLLLRRKKFRF